MADEVVLNIQPPADETGYRTWVLWATLEYLAQSAAAGKQFVPARDLRNFVRQYVTTDDSRDSILNNLRRVQAIDTANRTGSSATAARRYFITAIGRDLMESYRKTLEAKHA